VRKGFIYHGGHGIRFKIDTMDTIDRVQVSPYGSPSPLMLLSVNIDLIGRAGTDLRGMSGCRINWSRSSK
jgi:hypothetical protein